MTDDAGAREVRHLNPTEMSAWRRFIETYADLIGAIEADLAPTGVTLGDYQVLVHLSEAEGRQLRMCDLAEILQLTPSGTTRRLDGLVEHGWVERRSSTVDRRVMLAVLTDKGWDQLHTTLGPHVNSVREHLIDLMSTNELKAMASTFKKVRRHLDEQ